MSHPHTVIEPAEGLTVLIGENNTGKSALVNALQVLCRNSLGDYMVRHGEQECLIRVDTNEGFALEWKRSGKTVSYSVNGTEVHRLRSSVPDNLHEFLRLPLVEMENNPFDIHFGEQKSPIFLLNESAGRRAAFFASSSDAVKLIEMQNLHRRKVKEAKTKKSELLRQEAELKNRLDCLSSVKEIGDNLDRLEDEYKGISDEVILIDNLKQEIDALDWAKKAFSIWSHVTLVVSELQNPPQFKPTEPLHGLIASLENTISKIDFETSRVTSFSPLTVPPILEDISPFEKLIKDLHLLHYHVEENRALDAATQALLAPPQLFDTSHLELMVKQIRQAECNLYYIESLSDSLTLLFNPPKIEDTSPLQLMIDHLERVSMQVFVSNAKEEILQRCQKPPEISDLRDLESVLSKYEAVSARIKAVETHNTCLSKLLPPPEVIDVADLEDIVKKVTTAKNECGELEVELKGIKDEFAIAEQELREIIKQVGICPTCGKELDPEEFIATTPILAGDRL